MIELMGVINVTPDSFYINSRTPDSQQAIARGIAFYEQGANILDVGGESTRPKKEYSAPESIPLDEELKRVLPVIAGLKRNLPSGITLSIDTQKPEVARQAVEVGAALINDISGLKDPKMVELVKTSRSKAILMHMQNNPWTMQMNPRYEEGVVQELLKWFDERLRQLYQQGVDPEQLILDPGIGYGKSIEHNLLIIKNIEKFKTFNLPLLLGISRKIFMSKLTGKPATELLPTTLAMNTIAMLSGVNILRVHDIAEHNDVRTMIAAFMAVRNTG